VAEDEAAENESVLRWHALTADGRWDMVMEVAGERLRQAHLVCADPAASEQLRLVAMGEVKAWSEVRVWRDQFRAAYESMAAEQTKADEAGELVGSKLEDQWYERRP